jgi:VanZ family protein
MPSIRPLRRVLVLLLALAYWALLFAATHSPARDDAGPPKVRHLDKVQHLAAFAILGAITSAAAACFVTPGPMLYLGVMGLIGLYAAIDEWTQGWIQNRMGDPLDWLSDMLGASLGVLLFGALSAWRGRKK